MLLICLFASPSYNINMEPSLGVIKMSRKIVTKMCPSLFYTLVHARTHPKLHKCFIFRNFEWQSISNDVQAVGDALEEAQTAGFRQY